MDLNLDFSLFLLQTLYKTQVKELKEEIEEKNKETQRKIQELQNEKYVLSKSLNRKMLTYMLPVFEVLKSE